MQFNLDEDGGAVSIGQVEISFSFSRHVGPRYIHGAVTLEFDGLRPYSFVSQATWPAGDNYEAAVRRAVESALTDRLGALAHVAVTLKRIEFDSVNSSQVGFERAARAATLAAFDV